MEASIIKSAISAGHVICHTEPIGEHEDDVCPFQKAKMKLVWHYTVSLYNFKGLYNI